MLRIKIMPFEKQYRKPFFKKNHCTPHFSSEYQYGVMKLKKMTKRYSLKQKNKRYCLVYSAAPIICHKVIQALSSIYIYFSIIILQLFFSGFSLILLECLWQIFLFSISFWNAFVKILVLHILCLSDNTPIVNCPNLLSVRSSSLRGN